MKQQMKYKLRRLAAAIILLVIFMTFTVSVLVKGIDAEFERQDKVLENHFAVHGVER